MRFVVVLTAAFVPVAREILAREFDVVEHPTEAERSEEDLISILSEADAAITLLTDPLTRRVLQSNPNMRIIANHAVGYNNIDIDAARELGITITNTPDVLTEATADFTMAMMLAVTRRLVEGEREVREAGRVLWAPLHMLGSSLQGKRLGIIGMGRIGSAVAARAKAFGMEVIGVHRGEPIEDLMATSDIVSIHTPLTPETRHMIDPKRMKRGAYLVNTSRGAVIDENALCDALESGHLAGAALDVYEFEPKVNPRLLTMKNVVLTPHIASATVEARGAMARIAATDVYRVLKGQQPLHRVV